MAAEDVQVNYLTSLHSSGPEGWPSTQRPLAPPILASNGELYGLSHGLSGIYSLSPVPGHYVHSRDLYVQTKLNQFSGMLIQSNSGHLYGSAYSGNANSTYKSEVIDGAVFRAEFDGTGAELIQSTVGNVFQPTGVLVLDANENIYGLDRGPNNNGRIFKISTENEFSVLYEFTAGPQGQMQFPNGMVLASNGWLYGLTAYKRGIPFDEETANDPKTSVGTLYRMNPSDANSFKILHEFKLSEGEIPWFDYIAKFSAQAELSFSGDNILAHLVEASDGYLYGTTSIGTCITKRADKRDVESPLCGGKYWPKNTRTNESLFDTPYPHYDGQITHGAVFRIALDGSNFNILHEFRGEDGSQPRGYLAVTDDGHVYGTTLSGGQNKNDINNYEEGVSYPTYEENLTYDGTLYRIKINQIDISNEGEVLNSGFEHLHSFKGGVDADSDGKVPTGVALASNNRLYGTTRFGGRGYTSRNGKNWQNGNSGTVFEVDLNGDRPGAAVTVTATPGVIGIGETAEITWTSSDASNCVASGGSGSDGWSGNRDNSGSIKVLPDTGVFYYTLICDDNLKGGQAGDVITLRVDAKDIVSDNVTTEYGNGAGSLILFSPMHFFMSLGIFAILFPRRSVYLFFTKK